MSLLLSVLVIGTIAFQSTPQVVSSPSKNQLKSTVSRCPVCHRDCPATVWRSEDDADGVWLSRTCSEHGAFDARIATDARFYWLAKGDPSNECGPSCACPASEDGAVGTLGRNAGKRGTPEVLSTCLALIEIVDSCNLACPTCFADSPVGLTGNHLKAQPLADLKDRINGVLDRKGRVEILQLSGGEPTLHPDFMELLDWIHGEERIDYCLLNTNGLKLAKDDVFLKELADRARRGRFQLYLQYDGPQEAGQRKLRGGDFREWKHDVMERCERAKIPFTLAVTVNGDNLGHLWESISIGLRYDLCRGVSFQPMFGSGRGGEEEQRLNVADVILACVGQSEGSMRFEDFTPLPCGDPNCATIGYLLRTPAGTRSISDFIDFASVQGFLHDKVRYELSDLIRCGCENTELGELLHGFEVSEKDAFRVFVKPFMDSWTWDEDRIDRCCTHVIRPDGMLDSFCRYYADKPA